MDEGRLERGRKRWCGGMKGMDGARETRDEGEEVAVVIWSGERIRNNRWLVEKGMYVEFYVNTELNS